MGVGHTDEPAQHFDSEKLGHIFLAHLTGFEPRVFGSRDALPIEPPRHPNNNNSRGNLYHFFWSSKHFTT